MKHYIIFHDVILKKKNATGVRQRTLIRESPDITFSHVIISISILYSIIFAVGNYCTVTNYYTTTNQYSCYMLVADSEIYLFVLSQYNVIYTKQLIFQVSPSPSPPSTLSPASVASPPQHPAPGKDKNRKKNKQKQQPKARFKFHEYKGNLLRQYCCRN